MQSQLHSVVKLICLTILRFWKEIADAENRIQNQNVYNIKCMTIGNLQNQFFEKFHTQTPSINNTN